jgi:hypothetical protein
MFCTPYPATVASKAQTSAHAPSEHAARVASQPARTRTSDVLRGILAKNPGVRTFSVELILASVPEDHVEAALTLFAIPAIVPVPAPRGMVALPAGAIGYHLVSGRRQIKLPKFLLNKSVSRRALEVAIHAMAPILEAAEKVVRPRWSWVSHPISRRAVGMLVFLLAVAIAYPLFGFKALHALSLIVMSLGLAERDGLAVLIGLVAGVVSLVIVATCGVSMGALRAKVRSTIAKIARRLRLSYMAKFLDRLGFTRIARILTAEWSDLLMMWDPARRQPVRARAGASRAPASAHGGAPAALLLR